MAQDAMSTSVLTIVRNRAGHLAQLVEGLRRSDAAPRELIVVDMGSTVPVSVEETPFPCRIERLDCEGLPLAAARNAAARAAKGDTLLFLDVDCIPMRGLIAAMTDVLDSEDGLVCAQVRYLGQDDARSDWGEADLLARSSGHPARRFPASGLRRVENAGLFWSLVFGIRRERYAGLGGFDEAFTGYGAEDTDFGFRAKAAHVPLLFMGGPGAFHQHHDVFEPPLRHFNDILRNARTFHDKWGTWPMDGWLSAFAQSGLVEWDGRSLIKLRDPTRKEIADALVD
ncbi:family 2 glycosyl transferase [Sphingomonas sp. LH128]|uniref:glycosyltransferase family 2 protein n=1 Tax=Sphingomonas sp. LH128 TaxID=473781 RepID=UPI00027CAEF8|nr:glycosyltransferase [Sphingomonas sp. LH128]EJU09596.1 family 2 glycosyl transferase [Sphingomonas sp. LH128]